MKAVYFEERVRNIVIGGEANTRTSYFYVPDEDIFLYRGRQGDLEIQSFGLIRNERHLDELRALIRGKTPNTPDKFNKITYSKRKEFEYDANALRALIQDAKSKAELETKVRTGIEDLLKQVESRPEAD